MKLGEHLRTLGNCIYDESLASRCRIMDNFPINLLELAR